MVAPGQTGRGPDILPVLNFSLFLPYCLQTASHRLQTLAKMTLRHSAKIICNIKILVGFNWLVGLIDPICNFMSEKAWNCNFVDLLKICKISLSEMRYNYHNISICWVQPNTTTRNNKKTKCSFFSSIWCYSRATL